MSVEQAKSFIEKLDSDKAFLKEVAGAGSDEARLELAKAAGFGFTAEELASAIGETAGEELSEDQLEGVAGGYLKIGDIAGESFKFKKLFGKYTEVEWT
jgi:predicted ribosomally synthesized peptide with nif11-like leader